MSLKLIQPTAEKSEAEQLADMSAGAFASACGLLCKIFDTRTAKWEDLVPFVTLINIMRMLPEGMQEEYFKPVILAHFKVMGLDPTKAEDRTKILPFLDTVAGAMHELVGMLMQAAASQANEKPKLVRTNQRF